MLKCRYVQVLGDWYRYKCVTSTTGTIYGKNPDFLKEKSKYDNLARLDPAVFYIKRSECVLAMPEADIHKFLHGGASPKSHDAEAYPVRTCALSKGGVIILSGIGKLKNVA